MIYPDRPRRGLSGTRCACGGGVEGAACHGASAAVFFFPCLPCLFCFLTSFFSEPLYLGTLPYLNPERTYFCLPAVSLVCAVLHCFGDGFPDVCACPGPCNGAARVPQPWMQPGSIHVDIKPASWEHQVVSEVEWLDLMYLTSTDFDHNPSRRPGSIQITRQETATTQESKPFAQSYSIRG